MQDEFLRLQEKLKKTIMFITHDFDEALKLADRIAIMKDGIIEQLDTPSTLWNPRRCLPGKGSGGRGKDENVSNAWAKMSSMQDVY